ncbi:MAG: nucleoside transporter C-terminal domain-containing protein [Elusimicrobia bacterium]|nr:nucleoside transporter C-terminal domain-containing protein [Elusimicrobiota bacterium]
MNRLIGFVGIVVLLGLAWLMSNNKRRINLRTVGVGLGMQFALGLVLLKWDAGNRALQWFAAKVTAFLFLADNGTKFLFANLADPTYIDKFGFQFAFRVLPIIIFFASFMGILYYLGVMQKIVEVFAVVMSRLMKTSGSESLSCSANVFLGQTEAPLLVRPFLKHCTYSELNAIMVGGFGTIAGSVMAGYIGMGVPAEHIMVASVMAAPASLMIAKILVPETAHSETMGDTKLPRLEVGTNLLDAASRGVTDGLHLALNVAAMLIAFITLIALADKILLVCDRFIDGKILGGAVLAGGEYNGIWPGSLRTFFGSLLSPLALLMGIPRQDLFEVGNLLGMKLAINEFVAYARLAEHIKAGTLSPKSVMMATYFLRGFANFSSIGIQIGGISALEPSRRADLAKLGFKAMLGGAIVSCLTASIAGILIG